MPHLVITTGLLLKLDYMQSIRAFNELLRGKGIDSPKMPEWLAMMPAILAVDDKFKAGDIDAAQFQVEIQHLVSQVVHRPVDLTAEEFAAVWNEMLRAGFDNFASNLARLEALGLTVDLISGTNSIHFAYLAAQLDQSIVAVKIGETVEPGQRPVYTTYKERTTKLEIYQRLGTQYTANDEETIFAISDNEDIKVEAVKAREMEFSYVLQDWAMENGITVVSLDIGEDIVPQVQQQADLTPDAELSFTQQ